MHNQIESLLEEMRIKLSSRVSDLLGVSGYRMLRALAEGKTDPATLAALADGRLQSSQPELIEALSGQPHPIHLKLLGLFLDRYDVVSEQIAQLHQATAEALRVHQQAVMRLAEVPGFGADSAQQVIAEVGPQASTFDSAAQLASWAGVCPGLKQSAEENYSGRSAKGNRFLRRSHQAAQAAVRKKGGYFQALFQRLLHG